MLHTCNPIVLESSFHVSRRSIGPQGCSPLRFRFRVQGLGFMGARGLGFRVPQFL